MTQLDEAKTALDAKTGGMRPRVGVICGSGLSGLVDALDSRLVVNYADIPHFPQTTIAGHTGELVFGKVDAVEVVLMRGRFHSYEGHDMQTVTMPVKLMRALGVEIIIVTNAAGGVNRGFKVGDLMIISDHIGFPLLAGKHPLVGLNDDAFGGPRFPPMSDAYDEVLQQLVYDTALSQGLGDFVQRRGTYTMVSGPTYETGAEIGCLLKLGTDSVGMSTVPEVCVARHSGMRVIGLSLITNSARLPGDEGPVASHGEVLETVELRGAQIQALVKEVIAKLEPATLAKLEPALAAAAAATPATAALVAAAKAKTTAGAAASASAQDLKKRLAALDVSSMTPVQALVELHALSTLASSQ